MNNIELVDRKICTGCGACYNICPKNAINMVYDEEGFLTPIIDKEKCINCGLCINACAAYNPCYNNNKNPKCYAVWANDEIRMKSSSGGAFTLFANYVLDQGGYVCGAAWDKDFNVEHIIINNKNDLDKLRGSKYVQSNTNIVYKQIKNLLNNNKLVLFSGVPCQIAGLNKYLKKTYENLITIDLICHGVPSPKIWQKYLSEDYAKENIKKIDFRPKEYGWGTNFLEITDKNNKKKLIRSINDSYLNGFKKSLFVRNSCASCHFVKAPRQADITLGDFWGIEKYNTKLNDKKGTSCIITNNKKGERLFENVKKNFTMIKKIPFSFAKKHQVRLQTPLLPHPFRSTFFNYIKKYKMSKSAELALYNKYDIGIVGIWFFENYGAILTAYALYKLLQKMGYSSILIDSSGFLPNKHIKESDILSRSFFRKFNVNMTPIKSNRQELSLLNNNIDNFVLASDQLWRRPKPFGKTFFLDFAHDNKRKIAIATSFGDGYADPKEEWTEAKFHMQRLDRISVREDIGVDICKDIFNVKAEHILDPVFLCDFSVYEDIINQSNKHENQKYLLSYILDSTQEKKEKIENIAKKIGLKIVNITDGDVLRQKNNAQKGIEVEDWLYYFKNAEAIITDSFHGTSYAMIFKKPFISLLNTYRGGARFTSLLKIFKEEQRLIFDVNQLEEKIELLKSFDKELFENILESEKRKSIDWIKEALTFEKKQGVSTYDILSEHENKIIKLILCKNEIITKYWRYSILRKICFGKTRKRYKDKYKKYKELRKKIKSYIKGIVK